MRWERLGESLWIGHDLGAPAYEVAARIRSLALPGVLEVTPAFESVGVYVVAGAPCPVLPPQGAPTPAFKPKAWVVPVWYGMGGDLVEVAASLGLTIEELARLHSAPSYRCEAVGFNPGFPYLSGLHAPLDRVSRLEQPRIRVPAGSVAIAAGQCGIYPSEVPGGWRIIGRTPKALLDWEAGVFTIAAGDTVRFVPIDERAFSSMGGLLEPQ